MTALVLPGPPKPRYGIKDPLGPSDEVHRCLSLYAKQSGNRTLGPRGPIIEALAPLGYTAENLEKCVKDYSAIWNMYENEADGVAFVTGVAYDKVEEFQPAGGSPVISVKVRDHGPRRAEPSRFR